jgi:hypothetical protein
MMDYDYGYRKWCCCNRQIIHPENITGDSKIFLGIFYPGTIILAYRYPRYDNTRLIIPPSVGMIILGKFYPPVKIS